MVEGVSESVDGTRNPRGALLPKGLPGDPPHPVQGQTGSGPRGHQGGPAGPGRSGPAARHPGRHRPGRQSSGGPPAAGAGEGGGGGAQVPVQRGVQQPRGAAGLRRREAGAPSVHTPARPLRPARRGPVLAAPPLPADGAAARREAQPAGRAAGRPAAAGGPGAHAAGALGRAVRGWGPGARSHAPPH